MPYFVEAYELFKGLYFLITIRRKLVVQKSEIGNIVFRFRGVFSQTNRSEARTEIRNRNIRNFRPKAQTEIRVLISEGEPTTRKFHLTDTPTAYFGFRFPTNYFRPFGL